MPYAANRIVHDADSHLMELADCLDDFIDPKFRGAYDALPKLRAWRARVRRDLTVPRLTPRENAISS